jgi:hypothetical protein
MENLESLIAQDAISCSQEQIDFLIEAYKHDLTLATERYRDAEEDVEFLREDLGILIAIKNEQILNERILQFCLTGK